MTDSTDPTSGTTMVSALFPDAACAIADLRAMLSMSAGGLINLSKVSDTTLWNKLMAAEAEAERILKTFFGAVEVLPDNCDPSEIAAFEAAGTRYTLVSAFDYDPDLFRNDAWGYMRLPFAPIQQLHSVKIVFPAPFLQDYTVPEDWIRLDSKYGDLQLVPTTTAPVTPVGAYAVAMWGGTVYPQAVQMRYRCGLTNASGTVVTSFAQHWNDLVDVVQRMAIMKLLRMAFLPTSASISADGLSQSKSFDYKVWQDGIDEVLKGGKGANGGLFVQIHGAMGLVG
ncbi:hypothetical protein [Pararobbsia silviterrae]|nr:hypothetical protein [Pararobbsia silviterrae]